MTSYYLGFDIGGTKCHALLSDENGRILGFGKTGPGNHEVVGYEGLAAALNVVAAQALNSASLHLSHVSGAGFGIAGYDWPSQVAPTAEVIARLGLACPKSVVNDALIGLLAGAEQGWGVAVVGGTGSNAWGWNRQRRTGRVTGCGHLFGEYGGGGDVVIKALQAVSYAWSRRGEKTELTKAFLKYTGASSLEEMLEGFALGRFHPRPGAAPMVFEVANQGDPAAIEVMRWTGEQLAGLAVSVIRQLEFQELDFEIVLVGSLFKAGPLLIEPLREAILTEAPAARLVRLSAPPVVGGVLLGMEAAGLNPQACRERLISSYPHHLDNR